jgi:hypothetical protein
MGGYAHREGVALGTAEPLLATAVVLSAGNRPYAIVSLDLVAVTTPLSIRLRSMISSFGFDDRSLILAATHTHSSPGDDQRKLVADDLYYTPEALGPIELGVKRAIEAALGNAVEAELHAAGGLIEGIATSRVPGGPTLPPTGSLVLARLPSGRLIGAIVGYAAHPTVLGEDNLYYSPDFVGPFRTALRTRLEGVPVVFLNGPSGDLSTRSTRRERTFQENDRLGAALAEQFVPLIEAAHPINALPLAADSVSFDVEARPFPPSSEIDGILRNAKGRFREARDAAQPTTVVRTAENDLIGAEALADLAATWRDRHETATLRAIRFGDVAVIGLPVELFSELGHMISSPPNVDHLLIATCADGYLSYILPTPRMNEGHYEALVSWAVPGTGEQLVAAANQLLAGLVAGR